MPSIKDFEKENKKRAGSAASAQASAGAAGKKKTQPRRRPGRDETASPEDTVIETDSNSNQKPLDPAKPVYTADAHEETEPTPEQMHGGTGAESQDAFGSETGDDKIHLNFYGSELLRARAPKVFEIADAVADDWMKDGRFEALPVGHPLAQMAAQVGLRKAKDLEKKLEEKGVFMFARMGYQYAKSKLNKK